jgi:hypothetical protein
MKDNMYRTYILMRKLLMISSILVLASCGGGGGGDGGSGDDGSPTPKLPQNLITLMRTLLPTRQWAF